MTCCVHGFVDVVDCPCSICRGWNYAQQPTVVAVVTTKNKMFCAVICGLGFWMNATNRANNKLLTRVTLETCTGVLQYQVGAGIKCTPSKAAKSTGVLHELYWRWASILCTVWYSYLVPYSCCVARRFNNRI
jgi:hypothetical protein